MDFLSSPTVSFFQADQAIYGCLRSRVPSVTQNRRHSGVLAGGRRAGGRQRPHGASLTAHLLREAPRTACMLSPCRPHAVHPPKPQLPTPTVLGESGNKRLSLQMRVVSRSGASFPFHSREHSAFQLWNPGPCSFLLSVPLICLK